MRAPGRNAPLIRFFISALYIYILFACLYRMLQHLSFSLHFLLTYLLFYLSFPLRTDPLRFHAGCRDRRLNPAFVFCVSISFDWQHHCSCCWVRFSFFHACQETGLGNVSQMTYFCVECDVIPQLSQPVSLVFSTVRATCINVRFYEWRVRVNLQAVRGGREENPNSCFRRSSRLLIRANKMYIKTEEC